MGRGEDTSLGGFGTRFPSTRWSRILRPAEVGREVSEEAIGELAGNYWRPVYHYIRVRWSRSNDDAKDLTQEFFAWMIDRRFLDRADPQRGRFRAYVRTSLSRFLVDRDRHSKRQIRGGDLRMLSLDFEDDDPPELDDEGAQDPQAVLDAAWRREILERAMEALESRLEGEGKAVYFSVFKDYVLDRAEDVDYAQVAEKYGIAKSDVSNYLQHVKKRYRTILEEIISDTVETKQDLEEEIHWLLGASER